MAEAERQRNIPSARPVKTERPPVFCHMLHCVASPSTPATAPRAVTYVGRGGLRLAGDLRGDPADPPIVFLHGSGQSRQSWTASATALAADGWHTLTLDLRGHGDSERAPDGAYDLDDFGADVAAAIATLDRPPILIGASMGGSLALLVAAALAPGAVRGIVLADSAHRGDAAGQEGLNAFARTAAEGYASPEDALRALASLELGSDHPPTSDRLRHLLDEADGRWWWPWDPAFARLWASVGDEYRATHSERLLTAARGAGCPILLARGTSSRVVTEEVADEFCAAVPGVRRCELPGVGHMLTGDDNTVFVEAVAPFLAELRRAS